MCKFLKRHAIWIPTAVALIVSVLIVLAVSAAEPLKPRAPRVMADPPAENEVTFDMKKNLAYTADNGIVVIPANTAPTSAAPMAAVITDSPDDIWKEGEVVFSRGYTMPEQAQMANGSIGVLSIPKISLTVNVYETDDEMEAMTHGLAHFKTTSAWDGNIGICGHNVNFDLTAGFFKNLHTLKPGDKIGYRTALGIRMYTVETVAEIAETDWSYLGRTADNRITLITCITGKQTSRLVVQAVAD